MSLLSKMQKVIFIFFAMLLLNGCKRQPTKEEIIDEGNRRGMNLVDLGRFTEAMASERYLVSLVADYIGGSYKFSYRSVRMMEDQSRASVSFLEVDLESKEFKACVKDTLEKFEIETIWVVDESTADNQEGVLLYSAKEYRLDGGVLAEKSLGEIKPGIMTETLEWPAAN